MNPKNPSRIDLISTNFPEGFKKIACNRNWSISFWKKLLLFGTLTEIQKKYTIEAVKTFSTDTFR